MQSPHILHSSCINLYSHQQYRSGRLSGVGNGNPPEFLPGKFHGQRSLSGYNPRGCKQSDVTEHSCTAMQEGSFFSIPSTAWRSVPRLPGAWSPASLGVSCSATRPPRPRQCHFSSPSSHKHGECPPSADPVPGQGCGDDPDTGLPPRAPSPEGQRDQQTNLQGAA